jgi:Ring finger domain
MKIKTFHPHKTCTTGTADDLEKGCHSTSTVTTVPIATPIDDSPDAALDDIEAPAQSKLTEVKHSEDSMYTTSTEDMKADTVNVCNVSPVQSGDDSTCGHDQDDATTSDDSSGSDNMNETCAICYEALQDGDEITTSNCAKTFHRTCIITWLMLHDTCPYCRNTFKNINDNKNIDAILANDIFDCD